MKVISHGTEIVCTDCDDKRIEAEVKDRDGNTICLFFDTIDDLDLLAHELKIMAASIREEYEVAA